jgi:hypothetical protein
MRKMEPVEECTRIDREAEALVLESQGEATITMAKALLGMDLILVCFVDIGFRTGSYLFLWWTIAEGLLGITLLAVGAHQKSNAAKRLNAFEPR